MTGNSHSGKSLQRKQNQVSLITVINSREIRFYPMLNEMQLKIATNSKKTPAFIEQFQGSVISVVPTRVVHTLFITLFIQHFL